MEMYGGFLQALWIHLRSEKVTGDSIMICGGSKYLQRRYVDF